MAEFVLCIRREETITREKKVLVIGHDNIGDGSQSISQHTTVLHCTMFYDLVGFSVQHCCKSSYNSIASTSLHDSGDCSLQHCCK